MREILPKNNRSIGLYVTRLLKNVLLFLSRKKGNKFCAIEFYRYPPVGPQRHKIEPCLVVRAPGHDSVTLANTFFDLPPDVVADFGRIISDVYAGSNFKKPDGQAAA